MATTKAYSAQLIAVYTLALQFAKERNEIEMSEYEKLIKELDTLPDKIQEVIDNQEEIQKFAAKQAAAKDVFFIGRGIDYAVSLEGSLKLKEISYIHSEAYAAGELKHGTISLIEDGTLVIGVLTQDELYEKTISNTIVIFIIPSAIRSIQRNSLYRHRSIGHIRQRRQTTGGSDGN